MTLCSVQTMLLATVVLYRMQWKTIYGQEVLQATPSSSNPDKVLADFLGYRTFCESRTNDSGGIDQSVEGQWRKDSSV